MQGESPPVLVKEPYSSLLDSSCKTVCTKQYNVHLLIILKRVGAAVWIERNRKQGNLSCSIQ